MTGGGTWGSDCCRSPGIMGKGTSTHLFENPPNMINYLGFTELRLFLCELLLD
jgi:hypothetical protein